MNESVDEFDTISRVKEPAWINTALKYGIFFGLVSGVFNVIVYLTDMFSNIWLLLGIGFIISVTSIVLAHREYKSLNGGYMSYGRGFLIGLVMLIISGFISAVISYIYIAFVDPDVLERMKEVQIQFLEKFDLPEDKMDQAIADIEAKNTAGNQLKSSLQGAVFGALLLSLIVTAFTKRSRPEFE